MGGTAFVGSRLVQGLLKRKHDIYIFTRGLTPKIYNGKVVHLIGDRNNIQDLERNLLGKYFDAVYDINAYTQSSVEKLVKIIKDNTRLYTFCSTAAVYENFRVKNNEDSPRAKNPYWQDYGLNKIKAENYLLQLNEVYGFPSVVLRPVYIYGPENNLYREKQLFDQAMQEINIQIPQENSTQVQFIYVDDLIEIFISLLGSSRVKGQAFNCANPENITWQYLKECILEIVSAQPLPISHIKQNANKNLFPFRNVSLRVSLNKLEQFGLPAPKTSLKMGLKKTYQWYIQHCNK